MTGHYRGKRLFAGRMFAGRLWGPTEQPSAPGGGRPFVDLRQRKQRRDRDDDVLLFLLRR